MGNSHCSFKGEPNASEAQACLADKHWHVMLYIYVASAFTFVWALLVGLHRYQTGRVDFGPNASAIISGLVALFFWMWAGMRQAMSEYDFSGTPL